jgi:hypothetical protein
MARAYVVQKNSTYARVGRTQKNPEPQTQIRCYLVYLQSLPAADGDQCIYMHSLQSSQTNSDGLGRWKLTKKHIITCAHTYMQF